MASHPVLWHAVSPIHLMILLRVSSAGVTVLAWGNSVSDLLACRAIAREGHAKMAISVRIPFSNLSQHHTHQRFTHSSCRAWLSQGCYGEPIFNRFFGVALSYAIITLPTFPEPYTDGIFIDPSLAVSTPCLLAMMRLQAMHTQCCSEAQTSLCAHPPSFRRQVCFAFQTLALLVTLAAGMLDSYRIRAWLGWVLIGAVPFG